MVHSQEKKSDNSMIIQFIQSNDSVGQNVKEVERKSSDGFHSTSLLGFDLTTFSAAVQVRIRFKVSDCKHACPQGRLWGLWLSKSLS